MMLFYPVLFSISRVKEVRVIFYPLLFSSLVRVLTKLLFWTGERKVGVDR